MVCFLAFELSIIHFILVFGLGLGFVIGLRSNGIVNRMKNDTYAEWVRIILFKKAEVELVVRLAFGTRQEEDMNFTTPTRFLKYNCSDDDNNCNEIGKNTLLFSQMKKDDAREKFIGAKASMAAKSNRLDIDIFLSRPYNNEESSFYHGFLHEMEENVKDCILFMNGRFDLESFPPSANSIKKITAFANEHSNECLDGLIAKRGFFPPYTSNGQVPPEKKQWKLTLEGKEYY